MFSSSPLAALNSFLVFLLISATASFEHLCQSIIAALLRSPGLTLAVIVRPAKRNFPSMRPMLSHNLLSLTRYFFSNSKYWASLLLGKGRGHLHPSAPRVHSQPFP